MVVMMVMMVMNCYDGDAEDDGQHILRKFPILNRNKRSKVIQEKAFQKVFWFCVCTVRTVL